MTRGLALWLAGFLFGVGVALMVRDARGFEPGDRMQGPAGGIRDQVSIGFLGPLPPEPLPAPFIGGLYPERPIALWAEMLPASAAGNPYPWAADRACMARWDRFDWREYAVQYPWPVEDVGYVVYVETAGTMDLCSVNRSSGATCWLQLLSGDNEAIQRGYLNPRTCMDAAYAKWLDGGGDFARHWFNHWTGPLAAEAKGE